MMREGIRRRCPVFLSADAPGGWQVVARLVRRGARRLAGGPARAGNCTARRPPVRSQTGIGDVGSVACTYQGSRAGPALRGSRRARKVSAGATRLLAGGPPRGSVGVAGGGRGGRAARRRMPCGDARSHSSWSPVRLHSRSATIMLVAVPPGGGNGPTSRGAGPGASGSCSGASECLVVCGVLQVQGLPGGSCVVQRRGRRGVYLCDRCHQCGEARICG